MTDSPADHSDDSVVPEIHTGASFAPNSPQVDHYFCPPRLGISHLLIWTAVVAVYLKLFVAVEAFHGETATQLQLPQAVSILLHMSMFVYSVTHAAAIVGVFILLRAKIRGCPGRLQPGHWFVLAGGVASLAILSSHLLLLAFMAKDDSSSVQSIVSWTTSVFGVQMILQMGIYLCATWASKGSKRWQVPFALLATASLLHAFMIFGIRKLLMPLLWWIYVSLGSFNVVDAVFVVRRVFSVAAIVILLVAVVLDLINRERRDWLHWVGIAVIFMTTLVQPAISWIVNDLLRSM